MLEGQTLDCDVKHRDRKYIMYIRVLTSTKKAKMCVFMHFVSPWLWAVPVFLHYDPAGPQLSPGSTSPTGYPRSQPSWPGTDRQRRWRGANKGLIMSARVITSTQVNVLLTAMQAWKPGIKRCGLTESRSLYLKLGKSRLHFSQRNHPLCWSMTFLLQSEDGHAWYRQLSFLVYTSVATQLK